MLNRILNLFTRKNSLLTEPQLKKFSLENKLAEMRSSLSNSMTESEKAAFFRDLDRIASEAAQYSIALPEPLNSAIAQYYLNLADQAYRFAALKSDSIPHAKTARKYGAELPPHLHSLLNHTS